MEIGAELLVKHGDKVVEGQGLFQWDPYSDPILSKVKGKVEQVDEKTMAADEVHRVATSIGLEMSNGGINHRLPVELEQPALEPLAQIVRQF